MSASRQFSSHSTDSVGRRIAALLLMLVPLVGAVPKQDRILPCRDRPDRSCSILRHKGCCIYP